MLKRLLWITGSAVGLIVLGLIFVWRQVTYVPTGYAQSNTSSPQTAPATPTQTTPAQIQEEQKRIWGQVSNTLGKYPASRGEVQLSPSEVNTLISAQLLGKKEQNPQPPLVSNTNTRIENGKVIIGTVLDVEGLSKQLGEGERAQFVQTLSKIPGLNNRSIYIEAEGKPVVRNRKVGIEDNASFKVGNISMDISQLAKYTGISQALLKDRITRGQVIIPMEVEDVKIENNNVVIRGSRTAS